MGWHNVILDVLLTTPSDIFNDQSAWISGRESTKFGNYSRETIRLDVFYQNNGK